MCVMHKCHLARMTDHFRHAELELRAALNESTLVDDLPLDEANTYDARRARYRAHVAMDAAQVHATLALVQELRHEQRGETPILDALTGELG